VEEANFLKDKLCNLLKEFQDKKYEKTAVMSAVGIRCVAQHVEQFLYRCQLTMNGS
jgi:hypothetical protein